MTPRSRPGAVNVFGVLYWPTQMKPSGYVKDPLCSVPLGGNVERIQEGMANDVAPAGAVHWNAPNRVPVLFSDKPPMVTGTFCRLLLLNVHWTARLLDLGIA